MHEALFSSATDEWSTPNAFFQALNAEFRFELDVCATAENAKCAKYYTREQDGLAQKWGGCAGAIPRMAERSESGYKRAPKAAAPWLCFCLRGQTQNGSTSTYTAGQRCALCAGA